MRLANIRQYIFSKHCHPISAWSRLITTPLLLVPAWKRDPLQTAGVAAWFAVNPVMIPAPKHHRAFATRAMLGEELWSAEPASDRTLIGINAVGTIVLGTAMIAAWKRRPVPAAIAIASSMVMTLVSWQRYAAIFDRQS